MPTELQDERLKRLIAKRGESIKARTGLITKQEALVANAKEEGRQDLFEEEEREFQTLSEQISAEADVISGFDERIKQLTDQIERDNQISEGSAAVRRAQARVAVVNEGQTYAKGNGRSYVQDMVRVQMNMDDSGEARARLERHAIDVRGGAEYRDLTTADGSGAGYFVPPAWLISDYADVARAGRVTANLVHSEPLPAGTNSINIPLLTTGAAVAIQDGENTSVQETDIVDSSVSAAVRTIAGQEDVSIQALDQSPVSFDRIVFESLMSDYAVKLDKQVISGTNANSQVKGILAASSTIGVTYTDTSPTVGEFYAAVADAVQQLHTNRLMPPTVIVMHPRRWGWLLSARDDVGRPLVVPSGPGQNQIATANGVVTEGIVGNMLGLPVAVDANLPINLGTGTNEDRVLVLRANDLLLWESSVKSRVLPDVGSGTLTVRFQVYGYIAFTAEFRPKATAIISGTGLVTPTFV